MGDICGFAEGRMPKQAAFAFNTNVDAVARLDTLKGLRLPGLVESIASCAQKEMLVGKKTAQMLSKFGWGKTVGGQAGRGAQAAAYLGVKSLLNIPVSCREQNRFFHPNVYCAGKEGLAQAARVTGNGEPPVHYVIEYARGMRIAGQELQCTNRFIASYNGNVSGMDEQEGFIGLLEKEIPHVGRVMLAGAHLLPENRIGRIDEAAHEIGKWRRKNPALKVHFECGEFQSEKVAKKFLSVLAPKCDSIGINDIECRQLSGKKGNMFEAAEGLLEHSPAVVLHMPQFACALSKKGVEWKALAFGNLAAAFYLEHGRFANFGELETYGPRERAADRFTFEYRNAGLDCASEFAPTYAILPKLTVGGGDVFAAGFALTC